MCKGHDEEGEVERLQADLFQLDDEHGLKQGTEADKTRIDRLERSQAQDKLNTAVCTTY